jgi:hypothetical protein
VIKTEVRATSAFGLESGYNCTEAHDAQAKAIAYMARGMSSDFIEVRTIPLVISVSVKFGGCKDLFSSRDRE